MRHGFFTVLALAGSVASSAQQVASAGAPYTLRTTARAVVTDVLVHDGKGNPIHGLPLAAFHLFDNGKPVTIASFEEHTGNDPAPAVPVASAPGVYTNDPARLPPVLDIVVIDLVSLDLPDQMFLAYQLERFMKTLPQGIALAVYLRAGSHSVLIQDFTYDRIRLLAAVHRALPHFASLGSFASGLETLQQIAVDLKALPGRKNVIWFAGSSSLSFNAVGSSPIPNMNVRELFDALETERIAVYPIDARGLTTSVEFSVNQPYSDFYNGGPSPANPAFFRRALMMDVAKATGGVAYYNTNGLQQAADHVVRNDNSFYTLAYTPGNLQIDNKWHNIKVSAEGRSLHLSYRRGYFADDEHVSRTDQAPRTRLLAGGKTVQEAPAVRSVPIIFSATVQPFANGLPRPQISGPPSAGNVRYRIHYTLPATAFQRQSSASAAGQTSELTVGVGVLAMNRNGTPLMRKARQSTFEVNETRLSRNPNTPVEVDQDIDLAKGDTFLYLVAWDPTGERVGTLNIPLQVP